AVPPPPLAPPALGPRCPVTTRGPPPGAPAPPAGAGPTPRAPVVLPSGPARAPGAVVPAGAAVRKPRPRLPFTGANLLTLMSIGAALIVLGLMLKRWELFTQAP